VGPITPVTEPVITSHPVVRTALQETCVRLYHERKIPIFSYIG